MMKRALSFLLAVIALVCFTAALADGSSTDSEITVKGTGTVKVNPDLAVVILGVQKSGKDVAVIQGQVNAVIADITNAFTDDEIGIVKTTFRQRALQSIATTCMPKTRTRKISRLLRCRRFALLCAT